MFIIDSIFIESLFTLPASILLGKLLIKVTNKMADKKELKEGTKHE